MFYETFITLYPTALSIKMAESTPEQEKVIQGVVDQTWETYDVDKSGYLDKKETKKFVQETLGKAGSEFSESEFNQLFSNWDTNNSGKVEKNEIFAFIKQLLGF